MTTEVGPPMFWWNLSDLGPMLDEWRRMEEEGEGGRLEFHPHVKNGVFRLFTAKGELCGEYNFTQQCPPTCPPPPPPPDGGG